MTFNRSKNSPNESSLNLLKVISSLEIGPVKIEPRRLVAPYKVHKENSSATTEFIYSYDEDVFDPGNPTSLNLAQVMAAQVALNYGLFAHEIIFRGPYDPVDTRFITDMMENTSREIYVKKFLEPNPFLKGQTANLPPVRQHRYTQAVLKFPDSSVPGKNTADYKTLLHMDKNRHLVLSSGGKDSLLSFGILKELGRETHPVFINESGRHWFTALNAFRYFSKNYKETARVWTNSDRLFSWMLRHFPFIREDFSSIRSDEYPIRLWTVAVFLFGALPIMFKRKIGRLIIGDEFDTTTRENFSGITHYNGLYDQSIYFDKALTRYYQRKGWNIHQFSLLRPLSELLIEKILYERFPHLQTEQMSCHAAHIEEGRVHPCGKCEKCRRIVGMLLAFDGNPENCGYTPKQIQQCLKAISEKGVHQESAGAKHLAFLLKNKGLISASSADFKAEEHPEIMKIRIDPEKSPFDAVPLDLRRPLFKIFLTHASGAVKRAGRKWVEFDPYSDPSFNRNYNPNNTEYDSKNTEKEKIVKKKPNPRPCFLLGELSWPEAKRYLQKVDIALLPVGSTEQHGPHLPLDTDAFDAELLARKVAQACSNPKPLVLPLIPYGVSYHHEDFSGTISLSPDSLSQLVYEIGLCVAKQGITKLVIINGHGGNIPALQFAAQKINRDSHIFTCVETGETSEKDMPSIIETPNDVHAGEIETSTALATRPHLVKMDKAKRFVPKFSIKYLNFSSKRRVDWYARVSKISTTGVLGDPTKATRQKGEQIWEVMIKHLVEFVEDLKSLTLEEIYQKRY